MTSELTRLEPGLPLTGFSTPAYVVEEIVTKPAVDDLTMLCVQDRGVER
jgi:hypothetical protein